VTYADIDMHAARLVEVRLRPGAKRGRTPIRLPSLLLYYPRGGMLASNILGRALSFITIDTVQIYLHANLELKEQALAKTEPFNGRVGRFKPDDKLLAFLQGL
jgi:hypothetical protein